MRLRKSDLWWLTGYPVYQILGTIRHEGSHALAAILQGAHIIKFQVLPSIVPDGRFFWGYVIYAGGHPTWLNAAAPYFCDVLTLPLFSWLALRDRRMPHWLWVNVFVLGVLSPLANTLYNYQNAVIRHRGDVFVLLTALPNWAVHTVFLAAILLMGAGTWATIRSEKPT
jgi:hypothetical protein